MIGAVITAISSWAENLRFPRLLLLTAGLFVADFAIPDMIPFVDEILLALATIILGRTRTPKAARQTQQPG
jgi:hypothetical protein